MKPEYYTKALQKLKSYCAYQERCEFEIVSKLRLLGINEVDTEHIVEELKQQNYLNNTRYTEAFVSGKHNIKGWGKVKIKLALKAKQISEELILKTIQNIDTDDYLNRLKEIAEKKWKLLHQKKDRITRKKLFTFLFRKGFESDNISRVIEEMWTDIK